MSNLHNLVAKQFSPRAAAYAASAVHASGEDLGELAAFAQAHTFARALDLGCGGGHASFAIAPFVGDVTAYDLSADMLGVVAQEAAKRNIANLVTREGAVEELPFADASFDFVVTRFSAHHWHDVPRALGQARRVLKPGGFAMIFDVVAPDAPLPDTFLQTVEMLRDPSHVRDYSRPEWKRLLKTAGFSPATPTRRRLRLDFASWIARMQTPKIQADAIRALQAQMSEEVKAHFEIEADGSFTIDTASFVAG